MAGGQPTKYKKEYCKQLIDFMATGRSYVSFAAKIGVGKNTLYQWEQDNPEFSDAKSKAMAACEAWWEEQGHRGAWDQEGTAKLNPSKWIFNMKARFGWRDKEPDVVVNNITKADTSEELSELKDMINDINRPLSERPTDTEGLLKK